MSGWDRRRLVRAAAGLAASLSALGPARAWARVRPRRRQGTRPLVIASSNGLEACRRAMELLRESSDTLEAAVAGVNLVEEDPEDTTVGYGGLPNEDGVVQLDSSVMHGPTRNGGAVAALEGIVHPSRVAKLVMERTDHVLLVAEGAQRFARAHGFEVTDLLTDRARRIWLRWKETLSDRDDWLAPEAAAAALGDDAGPFLRDYGTINCNCVDANGDISGVTTTSGLAFKIPGRVGDSPILGAGLYVDNDVGACGSTGRGEANLLDCCSFLVVEQMRLGKSPADACIAALERVADKTVEPRLLTADGRPAFNLRFYALDKAGDYAGASMYGQIGDRTARFAVNDGDESRLEDCVALYDVMPEG